MPPIPLPPSPRSPVQGLPSPQAPRASPESFGVGIGSAIAGLGAELGQTGQAIAEVQQRETARRRQESVANRVAQTDLGLIEQTTLAAAPADGAGLADNTRQGYMDEIDRVANTITDPVERQQYRTTMLNQVPSRMDRATVTEFNMREESAKAEANANLQSMINRVRADPTRYEEVLIQGADIIDARPGLTEAMKRDMVLDYQNKVTAARFQGMIIAAKTEEDFDAIEAELMDPEGPWQSMLSPEVFSRGLDVTDAEKERLAALAEAQRAAMLDQITRARATALTEAGKQASAALTSAMTRAGDRVVIPPEELARIEDLVTRSGDITQQAQFEELKRRQEINTTEAPGMTADQMRARSDTLRQGRVMNLPPEVSTPIEGAAAHYGLNPGYLGGTAWTEYRGPLTAGGVGRNATVIGADRAFEGASQAALEGLNIAAQIFGGPIRINSGVRTTAQQQAIQDRGGGPRPEVATPGHSAHEAGHGFDISTAGMSPTEVARLADSMIQAGFTGFGQYPTHIHVDMRSQVPNTFGAAGRGPWLGWTTASPEVYAVLQKRGFTAGALSSSINRAPGLFGPPEAFGMAAPGRTNVDYGVGTGGGASTALGLMQFTEATWLRIIQKPSFQAATGFDISAYDLTTPEGRTAALALRADPRLSVYGAADLAAENRDVLRTTFNGREPTDSELHMAHVLGAGGAVALIRARQGNPNQIGAEVLPEAADSNGSIFYAEGGRPRTVNEVYNEIASRFLTGPSQRQYAESQHWDNLETNQRTGQQNDPMRQAVVSTLLPSLSDLSTQQGWVERGPQAAYIADQYNIPTEEMKPFSVAEATELKKLFDDGTYIDQIAILERLQTLNQAREGLAEAGMEQLGIDNTAAGWASALMFDRGNPEVARQIMVGGEMRHPPGSQSNEDAYAFAFVNPDDPTINAGRTFNSLAASALSGVNALARPAIKEAVDNYYVARYAKTGTSEFDATKYEAAFEAVMGTEVAEINGQITVLPQGIDAPTFETFLDKLTEADMARLSESGQPPLYTSTFDVVLPSDVAKDGHLQWIGQDQYIIYMGPDKDEPLGTYDFATGQFGYYKLLAPPEEVEKIVNRAPAIVPGASVPSGGGATLTFRSGETLRLPGMPGWMPGTPPVDPALDAVAREPGVAPETMPPQIPDQAATPANVARRAFQEQGGAAMTPEAGAVVQPGAGEVVQPGAGAVVQPGAGAATQPTTMTPRDAASLPPAAIAAMPAAEAQALAAVSPAAAKRVEAVSAGRAITPTTAARVTPAQAALWTPDTAAAVSSTALAALRPEALAAVPPRAVAAFTPEAIGALPPSTLAAMTPRQAAQVTPEARAAITSEGLAAMRPAAREALPAAPAQPAPRTQATPPAALEAAPAAQALTPARTRAMQPAAAAQVTRSEAAALSPDALAAFKPEAIGALSVEAIGALAPATIARLTMQQAGFIHPPQAAALTPEQVAAMLPQTLASLEPRVVAAMSVEAIGAITPAQASAISPLQAAAVTPEQRAAFTSPALAAMRPDTLEALPEQPDKGAGGPPPMGAPAAPAAQRQPTGPAFQQRAAERVAREEAAMERAGVSLTPGWNPPDAIGGVAMSDLVKQPPPWEAENVKEVWYDLPYVVQAEIYAGAPREQLMEYLITVRRRNQ